MGEGNPNRPRQHRRPAGGRKSQGEKAVINGLHEGMQEYKKRTEKPTIEKKPEKVVDEFIGKAKGAVENVNDAGKKMVDVVKTKEGTLTDVTEVEGVVKDADLKIEGAKKKLMGQRKEEISEKDFFKGLESVKSKEELLEYLNSFNLVRTSGREGSINLPVYSKKVEKVFRGEIDIKEIYTPALRKKIEELVEKEREASRGKAAEEHRQKIFNEISESIDKLFEQRKTAGAPSLFDQTKNVNLDGYLQNNSSFGKDLNELDLSKEQQKEIRMKCAEYERDLMRKKFEKTSKPQEAEKTFIKSNEEQKKVGGDGKETADKKITEEKKEGIMTYEESRRLHEERMDKLIKAKESDLEEFTRKEREKEKAEAERLKAEETVEEINKSFEQIKFIAKLKDHYEEFFSAFKDEELDVINERLRDMSAFFIKLKDALDKDDRKEAAEMARDNFAELYFKLIDDGAADKAADLKDRYFEILQDHFNKLAELKKEKEEGEKVEARQELEEERQEAREEAREIINSYRTPRDRDKIIDLYRQYPIEHLEAEIAELKSITEDGTFYLDMNFLYGEFKRVGLSEEAEEFKKEAGDAAIKYARAFLEEAEKVMEEKKVGVNKEEAKQVEGVAPIIEEAVAETAGTIKEKVKVLQEELKKMPEEKRKKIGLGLGNMGFFIEEGKNKFFAKIFKGASGLVDKKGTMGRFLSSLGENFEKDAELARGKIEEIAGLKAEKKKTGWWRHKLANPGYIAGNTLKYGRTVADIAGPTIASPLRYVMMGGMFFARGAGAAKEARLKNEKVIEKTRIEDIDKAAEEAWRIYEEAKKGKEEVSREDLEKAYKNNIPQDILNRLKNNPVPGTASSLLQKALKIDIGELVGRIDKKIKDIEADKKLTEEEKARKKEEIINKYSKHLQNLDKVVSQYGAVDALAMGARYAETAAKAVVAGMMVETLAQSIQKLWESGLPSALSKKIKEVVHGFEKQPAPISNIVSAKAEMANAPIANVPAGITNAAMSNAPAGVSNITAHEAILGAPAKAGVAALEELEVKKGASSLGLAKEIYIKHAQELGYKQEMGDVKQWAETASTRHVVGQYIQEHSDEFKALIKDKGAPPQNPAELDKWISKVPKGTFEEILHKKVPNLVYQGDIMQVDAKGDITALDPETKQVRIGHIEEMIKQPAGVKELSSGFDYEKYAKGQMLYETLGQEIKIDFKNDYGLGMRGVDINSDGKADLIGIADRHGKIIGAFEIKSDNDVNQLKELILKTASDFQTAQGGKMEITIENAEAAGIKLFDKEGLSPSDIDKVKFWTGHKNILYRADVAKEFFELSERTNIKYDTAEFQNAFRKMPPDLGGTQKEGYMRIFGADEIDEGVKKLFGENVGKVAVRNDGVLVVRNAYGHEKFNILFRSGKLGFEGPGGWNHGTIHQGGILSIGGIEQPAGEFTSKNIADLKTHIEAFEKGMLDNENPSYTRSPKE